MSGVVTMGALPAGSRAARAVQQADDSILDWLAGLVSGKGNSPAHIIVTGILGVVPGVGQVMDVRDIIIGVIAISKSPKGASGWVDLVITLIGCIPAVGDALKVGFKLMKQGKSFGRVLEAVSPKLRGNVERYMRNINWASMAAECKGLFRKTLDAFIDGIDSWGVRALAGSGKVKTIVGELQAVQRQGPKMIDNAFAELKTLHSKMMGHGVPANTAAVRRTSPTPARGNASGVRPQAAPAVRKPGAPAPVAKKTISPKPQTQPRGKPSPNTAHTSQKQRAKPRKRNWASGIPAEHITDYYAKKKHINFKKANNNGMLTEETHVPHTGIDHLWSQKGHPSKPFVVGETKSSIFDSLGLIAALPADLAQRFSAIRADESANPVKNGKPNVFDSEARDGLANQRTRVDAGKESVVRGGVNKPDAKTGLPTQMSHAWINYVLPKEKLTTEGRKLQPLINKYTKARLLNRSTPAPYKRWISLVTGRQLDKHKKSKGQVHDIQAMLDLPDGILDK